MSIKKPKLKFIGANVPEDIYQKILKRSQDSGRSLSKEIFFMLREALEA